MAQRSIGDDSIERAVKITIAAIPLQNGSWISTPQKVAEFIEVIARKIDELKGF